MHFLIFTSTAYLYTIRFKYRKTEDLTDHQTKLTPRQIADVQKSWENIRDDRVSMVFSTFVKCASFSY